MHKLYAKTTEPVTFTDRFGEETLPAGTLVTADAEETESKFFEVEVAADADRVSPRWAYVNPGQLDPNL